MGFLRRLFARRPPPELPPVPRRILVRGLDRPGLRRRIAEYEGVLGRPSVEGELRLGGPLDGWQAVVLPPDLHAYWFHNLALWLADGQRRVLALSEGPGETFGYWLADDRDFPDFLAGWTLDGALSVAVHVPDNQVARGLRLGLAAMDRDAALRHLGVPRVLADAPPERLPGGEALSLRVERLGAELNPAMEATLRRREDAAADFPV